MTETSPTRSDACGCGPHSQAVEDYLKAVFRLSADSAKVTTSRIAEALSVSAPSVSGMVKRLAADDLVARDRAGVALTEHGQRHALRIVRRHRLLETFLAQALDLPWDQVHAEAEVLEHALSERLEERIDAVLGHPTRDPHGDPIPPRTGTHRERTGEPLDAAAAGGRFRVERVSDRDSGALRHLAGLGVTPGAVLRVERRDPFGGPLWVSVDGRRHALAPGVTRLIHGSVLADQ